MYSKEARKTRTIDRRNARSTKETAAALYRGQVETHAAPLEAIRTARNLDSIQNPLYRLFYVDIFTATH
jgi:hypothetical protein